MSAKVPHKSGNMVKTNAVLPPEEVQALAQLRAERRYSELYTRTLALRNAHWPLRSIATPLGVSRPGVKSWEDKARRRGLERDAAELSVAQLPLDSIGSGVRAVRRTVDVPDVLADRLRDLAPSARRVRRWSAPDSEERRSSTELDELVYDLVRRRRVQPQTVARHTGVTRRAIVARLERIESAL